MAKRFSAADKGKSIVGNPSVPPRIRIHAPNFDPSELIKENMLTLSQCPERASGIEKPQSEPHRNCPRYLDTLADTRSSSRDPRSPVIPLARSSSKGWTGMADPSAIESRQLLLVPRNKIAPAVNHVHPRRLNHQGEVREDGSSAENRHSPRLQWRANSPTADQEATSQQRQSRSPRPSLGCHLDVTDFPPLPIVPSTKEVMEELRELTLQYMNVEDPTERAARQQRVLQSELDGTVEATAANIIQASTTAALASIGVSSPQVMTYSAQVADSENVVANPVRRRGRPARSSTSQSNIRLNPKTYAGIGVSYGVIGGIYKHCGSKRDEERRLVEFGRVHRGLNHLGFTYPRGRTKKTQ
ncbi:hypothetical protein F2Q69_00055182 [Brassica cretica]|uniref:Uncharacterized protein n=1 Tax=Brassica cretica TaxID=69181 RepID=A0A8S9N939_BRACR|nr:hypothetical protein F2Q69_00055182 [Brassica cretica]